MSPGLFLQRVVEPGLALLPTYMTSDTARVMLMAIAGQESNLRARAQVGGPALGYWQFEQNGVDGVMKALPTLAQSTLTTMDVPTTAAYQALEFSDPLACVFARLLLWSDVAPLPVIGDQTGAWTYYTRNWQPGAPDQTRWAAAYTTAVSTVAAGAVA